MTLSKPVYEALPYAYILTGSTVLITQNSLLAWASGLLLYAVGAIIWLLRARYRCAPAAPTRRVKLPVTAYEAAPFIYIAAGLFCHLTYLYAEGGQTPMLTLAAAVMLYGAGYGSWFMRAYYRGYHRTVRITNA